MAKNLDDGSERSEESEGATKGHNSAEREKIIREVNKELDSLDAQAAEISAARKEQKARIKGLGVKISDFNLARRIRNLEHEARDEALDTVREVFKADKIGSQGSLMPGLEG